MFKVMTYAVPTCAKTVPRARIFGTRTRATVCLVSMGDIVIITSMIVRRTRVRMEPRVRMGSMSTRAHVYGDSRMNCKYIIFSKLNRKKTDDLFNLIFLFIFDIKRKRFKVISCEYTLFSILNIAF